MTTGGFWIDNWIYGTLTIRDYASQITITQANVLSQNAW